MANAADWRSARNILCVRLDGAGDVLMTTPAIRALKTSALGRHVTLLTSAAGAEVAALVPEVDEVITYDAPWMKATAERTSAPDYALLERLRKCQFDASVVFTVFSQSPLPAALSCYLAGVPLRLAHCRENPYQLLTDWLPETEPHDVMRHESHRQLDLVAAIGSTTRDLRLSLKVPHSARFAARRTLRQAGVDITRPWLVMHPGASAQSRRYPPEQMADAAQMLVEDGHQIVLTGGHDETLLVQGIRGMMGAPSVSLAGRLSLPELAAVVSEAPLLVSNNTLPVHIAAAVQTPVVDLYALTNPQHTPWQVPSRVLSHDVPCRNCYKSVCPQGHHNCLRLVDPREVVEAVRALLEETEQTDSEVRHAAVG